MLPIDKAPSCPDYPAPPSNPPSAPGSPPPEYSQLTKTTTGPTATDKKDATSFGFHKFHGEVAAKYLKRVGLPADVLNDSSWTIHHADKVTEAIVAWGEDHHATMATHWFQPLGSGGLRMGQTGQVHNAIFNFNKSTGLPEVAFDGDTLLKGETDGSSYMNGGLRNTHCAGAYTALDPSSPIFIRGDTIHIPSVFVSFEGRSLDEKTPLLRAMQAVSVEGVRLLSHLGFSVAGVQPNIGLEQEFFLVPRAAYETRMDLQLAGRTVMGCAPARGQELSDHYMAPPNQAALACIKEIQHEAFLMGIPLKTRHREVAPNQYEVAPYFGLASCQIDENLMVMQLMEEIACKHGLACLLHEKPFAGVNGSGKHNNFSLGTTDGINLFNAKQLAAASGSEAVFPVLMAAVVRAVDVHADLLRMAIAAPGNDFRLGACEAPPAIISTYLGESLTNYLTEYMKAAESGAPVPPYRPSVKEINLGLSNIKAFTVPAEDRNRTSPFPYGGHRFEFRAVGSSQNVSMVNTVLCTAIADSFKDFCAKIEAGQKPHAVAAAALKTHFRVVFNGDGYAEEWPIEAGKRGLPQTDSGVEAISCLRSAKNVALFESLNVMSKDEAEGRAALLHEHYAGTVTIEAQCLITMMRTQILPACYNQNTNTPYPFIPARALLDLGTATYKLEAALGRVEAIEDPAEKAAAARDLRLGLMEKARETCDNLERIVPAGAWPFASYKELLFLDATNTHGAKLIA